MLIRKKIFSEKIQTCITGLHTIPKNNTISDHMITGPLQKFRLFDSKSVNYHFN